MRRIVATLVIARLGLVVFIASAVSRAVSQPTAGAGDGTYVNHATLTTTLQELADAHPDACELSSLGTSRKGRELWVLTLGRGDDKADRLGMAIVAGIDGNNPATTATAVYVAQSLLSATEVEPGFKLLAEHTVYIIPRVNPDGMESFFSDPRYEQQFALRPWDEDRDGLMDEDGPEDLNGDGLITMMRVSLEARNLSDLEAMYLPDPNEPRLLKKADSAKGEKPIYALLVEGIDNDGDGEYNEDAPGGVDLNRNFMHEYREHDPGVGPHQLSEPESRALIDFFLEHPRIAMAIFYGRHDNIVDVSSSDKSGAEGKNSGSDRNGAGGRRMMMFEDMHRAPEKAPTGLHGDDVSIYKQISEKYRKITGIKKVPPEPADGAVFAWAYAQYGIPSFACRIWTRPDKDGETKSEDEGKAGDATKGTDKAEPPESQSASADEDAKPDQPTTQDLRRQADTHEDDSSTNAKKGHSGGPRTDEKGNEKEKQAADKEAAAWLKYSDEQRDGTGFVPWAPFEHPQLGDVEIGGFAPFFRIAPPPSELDTIGQKQLAFVLDLAGRFPDISTVPPKVTRLSDTVYEIETELVNSGYFPSGLAIAELNRRVRPIVVSLDVEPSRVLGGRRIVKVWSIPGSAGRHRLRWVVQGEPGSTLTIKIHSQKYGDTRLDVALIPMSSDGAQGAEEKGEGS